jgi:hypothetical protein
LFDLGGRLDSQRADAGSDVRRSGRCNGQVLPEVGHRRAQRPGHGRRRHQSQVVVGEVFPQFGLGGWPPGGRAGAAEAGDHPADLGQRRVGLAGDRRLERGPAGQAVLAGDGQLGIVQGGELARAEASFRLELEVAQAGLVGKIA